MRVRAVLHNHHCALNGIAGRVKQVAEEDVESADVLVTWQDYLFDGKQLSEKAIAAGVPVVLVQHGRRATVDYGWPAEAEMLADVACVWGDRDVDRLQQFGYADRVVQVGCPFLELMDVRREPHKGFNVVFSPAHWTCEVPENRAVWDRLRDGDDSGTLTAKVMHHHRPDEFPCDRPGTRLLWTDVNMENHYRQIADLLATADLLVSVADGTLEGFAAVFGVPNIIVDCWKAKHLSSQPWKVKERPSFSEAVYVCEIDKLQLAVDRVRYNDVKARDRRKVAALDMGWPHVGGASDRIMAEIERAVRARRRSA